METTPILDNGFAMIPYKIVQELDLYAAAVWGVVYGFCKMTESGVCFASIQKIADRLGISYDTVSRNLQKLADAGYLDDQTPGIRNIPHTYKVGSAFSETEVPPETGSWSRSQRDEDTNKIQDKILSTTGDELSELEWKSKQSSSQGQRQGRKRHQRHTFTAEEKEEWKEREAEHAKRVYQSNKDTEAAILILEARGLH